jgi:hypothetical protein
VSSPPNAIAGIDRVFDLHFSYSPGSVARSELLNTNEFALRLNRKSNSIAFDEIKARWPKDPRMPALVDTETSKLDGNQPHQAPISLESPRNVESPVSETRSDIAWMSKTGQTVLVRYRANFWPSSRLLARLFAAVPSSGAREVPFSPSCILANPQQLLPSPSGQSPASVDFLIARLRIVLAVSGNFC